MLNSVTDCYFQVSGNGQEREDKPEVIRHQTSEETASGVSSVSAASNQVRHFLIAVCGQINLIDRRHVSTVFKSAISGNEAFVCVTSSHACQAL